MSKISVLLVSLIVLLFAVSAVSATVETGWTGPNVCKSPADGKIDFENGADYDKIVSQIPGVKFTTTGGYEWVYLVDSLNYPIYWRVGKGVAFVGVQQGAGRIDFTDGHASYVSVLVATYSGVVLEAYDSNGVLLADSGWSGNNIYSNTMTRLTVEAPDIAYVVVHDTGNYWVIDELCTDASGVNVIPSPEFPSASLPAIMIVGFLGAVLLIQRTKEN